MNKVINFLKNHGMYHGDFSLENQVDMFIKEMKTGLAGDKSSLLMIPTYVSRGKSLPYNEKVIAIDAGGTNLRASLISFNELGESTKEFFNKTKMPGTSDSEVSRIDFFDIIANLIKPMLSHSNKIGFCFSYPAQSRSDGDAKLLRWTKEIKASEVVGCYIGSELKEAIKRTGETNNFDVVVLNDTVTTLLTALLHSKRPYEGYMGYILGTGSNTAYEELNSSISKEKISMKTDRQIINIESGNYDGVPRGDFDKEANESWKSEGGFLEKMISGAYLGFLLQTTIKGAIKENLFSQNFSIKIANNLNKIELKDISDYLDNPFDSSKTIALLLMHDNEDDCKTFYELIDLVIIRTAKLVAINLCAPLVQSGMGQNPLNPVCINIDGTVYYNVPTIKDRVKYFMADYFTKTSPRYYQFANMEDASLLGAAVAGLIS